MYSICSNDMKMALNKTPHFYGVFYLMVFLTLSTKMIQKGSVSPRKF